MTLLDWLFIHALIGFVVGLGVGGAYAPELPFGVGFVLGFFWLPVLSWIVVRDVALFVAEALRPPSD